MWFPLFKTIWGMMINAYFGPQAGRGEQAYLRSPKLGIMWSWAMNPVF